MPTEYEPYDGDYIDADYTKLLNDVQRERGHDLGEYLEICVSLTDDDQLYILCSNDEGNEWKYSHTYPIPAGWDIEKVREMFSGYPVYLQTDAYQKPEDADGEEEDVDPYTQFCDDMANNPDDDLNIANEG